VGGEKGGRKGGLGGGDWGRGGGGEGGGVSGRGTSLKGRPLAGKRGSELSQKERGKEILRRESPLQMKKVIRENEKSAHTSNREISLKKYYSVEKSSRT